MARSIDTGLQGSIGGLLLRGGTSKGFFVDQSTVPRDEDLRDELILELFGTPDPLQIDGIGGSHSHTSKIILVSASDRPDVDVDYTFGQVAIETPSVDWSGNCGNLTSAVGVYAIYTGLVEVQEPRTEVTLYNTNTDTVVEQSVPVEDGEPAVLGDYSIDGVPGTGPRIDSRFLDPSGSTTGQLLPSGNLRDTVWVDSEEVEISLVDVGNLNVFVRARDVGLTGTELPHTISETEGLLETIERIRGAACELIGLVNDRDDAINERPAIPQIALISEPQSYVTGSGEEISGSEIDITSRIVTTQTLHHSYAMTGAMCLAAATQIEGTIPGEFVRSGSLDDGITLGHPKGTITVGVTTADSRGRKIESVRIDRTARLLMQGEAFFRYVGSLEQLKGASTTARSY